MNTKTLIGTLFLVGGIVTVLAGFLLINAWLDQPLPFNKTKTLQIDQGMTGIEIAQLLENKGVISSRSSFRWAIWLKGVERNLKEGTVRLNPPMSFNELMKELSQKHPVLIKVQLKEGWASWRIFSELSRKLKIPESQFEELMTSRRFIRSFGLEVQSLEGFLFPDTYYISADASARQVLAQLVRQYREIEKKIELRRKARKVNLTRNEAVTLASIIVREATLDRERNLISAVYHNRLDQNMPLQADPTLLYPLKNFDLQITHSMLNEKTPYNTYKVRGLPPTPISNPGEESLRASVEPEDVSYLYFVSKGNGKHVFSESLRKHQKAVNRYQRN